MKFNLNFIVREIMQLFYKNLECMEKIIKNVINIYKFMIIFNVNYVNIYLNN